MKDVGINMERTVRNGRTIRVIKFSCGRGREFKLRLAEGVRLESIAFKCVFGKLSRHLNNILLSFGRGRDVKVVIANSDGQELKLSISQAKLLFHPTQTDMLFGLTSFLIESHQEWGEQVIHVRFDQTIKIAHRLQCDVEILFHHKSETGTDRLLSDSIKNYLEALINELTRSISL